MAQTDRRTLELIQQARLLKDHYPHGQATLKAGALRWTGELQPSEISRQYLVDLRYMPPYCPRVLVRRPKLITDDNGNLPHIYPDGSLCLHEPHQWTPGDPIAKTTLPWTSEWLLHYELWRATGEWCGSGGNHTGPINRTITPQQKHPQRRSKGHVNDRNQRMPAGCGADLEEG